MNVSLENFVSTTKVRIIWLNKFSYINKTFGNPFPKGCLNEIEERVLSELMTNVRLGLMTVEGTSSSLACVDPGSNLCQLILRPQPHSFLLTTEVFIQRGQLQ